MNRRTLGVIVSLTAALAAGALWWFARPRPPVGREVVSSTAAAASRSAAASQPVPSRAAPLVPPNTAAQLDDLLARLTAANDPEASRRLLAELRRVLDALPPAIASREVQSFLTSHKDAGTKLDLTVKEGGALADASSLRVCLLDYLGQIDRAAAAMLGRQLLSAPTSPDEWAVSLRNVAWADDTPASRAYLSGKMRKMLAIPAWRENPSAGFLEAFDVIVHARGFDLTPQLTELVRDHDRRATAHAAYLTLDRLTLIDAATTLAPLAAQPDLMEGRDHWMILTASSTAVLRGARLGSTSPCSPLWSRIRPLSLESSTSPSNIVNRVRPFRSTRTWNSVPRKAPVATGVRISNSRGFSREKKYIAPVDRSRTGFPASFAGGRISIFVNSSRRNKLRSVSRTVARLNSPVRTRSFTASANPTLAEIQGLDGFAASTLFSFSTNVAVGVDRSSCECEISVTVHEKATASKCERIISQMW